MRTSGRTNFRRILATTVAVAALMLSAGRTAFAGGDWNDANVAWQPYEAGLAAAKKDKKPVLLIFFTEWCPHCTNYSKQFHDQKVIDATKKFVVIRLDKDKNSDLS
jgi:thiol:disulfide interchange protein